MARRVPPVVSDYFEGAASEEITSRDNVAAFRQVRFNPRYGIKLEDVDLRTEILGAQISMPVIGAPIGSLRFLWPKAEAAAAAAIGRLGTISCLSTLTGTPLEEVRAASTGPCWYQLYLVGGKNAALRGIARAKSAGYEALVLTIDTPVAGLRLRDQRNGSKHLITGSILQKVRFVPMMLMHLSWLMDFYADGGLMKFPNVELDGGAAMPYTDIGKQLQQAAVTWEDLPWIKEAWGGPIVIKGIHNVEDAKLAMKHGAHAIVISNHGGRQLDRVLPTLRILQDIAPAIRDGKTEIIFDGGVRSGADVVAALALGARCVMVGRALVYGLGAGGEAGVTRAFSIIRDQIEHTLRQLGCASIRDLHPGHLAEYPFNRSQ